MTSNLKIAGKTLTSADSNVTTSVALPVAKAASATSNTYTAPMIATGFNNEYVYNWYAATAAVSNVQNTSNASTNQDICPKGWQLPTIVYESNYDKDYYTLFMVAYGLPNGGYAKGLVSSPFDMTHSGMLKNGALVEATYGDADGYWSGTTLSSYNSGGNAFTIALYSDPARYGISYNASKAYGLSVRCVAK